MRVLGARARALKHAGLPWLYFFTDPARTPDPCAIAARLPRGAAVVYRHFGAPDRLATARRLRALAHRRGLVLLIGADPALAARIGADGVHLPQRMIARARALRTRAPGTLVTVAAHDAPALARARRAGAHAAFLSPVFPSASPSATQALGPRAAGAMARRAGMPVIALGGVNAQNMATLRAGFSGVAAVDAFL
jgi:thiamine-phosphate pyrophosphorylase